MKKNVGTLDKIIRIGLAFILTALYLLNIVTGTMGIILLVVAGVLILTTFISFCPIYWPFGISTRGSEGKRQELA